MPVAIVVIFLLVIAINPELSRFNAKNTFAHVIKVHFEGDTLIQPHIPNLLDQFSRTTLNQTTNEPLPPVPAPIPANSSRVRIKTTLDLAINFDSPLSAKGDLPSQIAAMRKHWRGAEVYYTPIEE